MGRNISLFAVIFLESVSACVGNEHGTPRIAVEDVYPWSAVAKLFNSTGGACTGVLVGPSTALTAAHCLYSGKTRGFLPPEAVHLLFGYRRGDYRVDARVFRYQVGPGYDPKNEKQTLASDWALLSLSSTVTGSSPVDIFPRPAEAGMAVAVAGFERTAAYVLTADMNCRINEVSRSLVLSDCTAMPGDSGGPLLAQDGLGGWRLLGLQVAITNTAVSAHSTISLSIAGTGIEQAIAEANRSALTGAEKN
jgi:protease YdgD